MTGDDPRSPGDRRDRAPWDRGWGRRSSSEPVDDGAEPDEPQEPAPGQVTVNELLRRLGHRDAPRRRRADDDPHPGTTVPPGDDVAGGGRTVGDRAQDPEPRVPSAVDAERSRSPEVLDAPTTRLPRVEDPAAGPVDLSSPPPRRTVAAPTPTGRGAAPRRRSRRPGARVVPPLPTSRLPALSGRSVPSLVRALAGPAASGATATAGAGATAAGAAAVAGAPATRLQAKKAQRHHRMHLAGRSLVAFVAAMVFLSTGAVWGATTYLDSQLRQVGALDQGSAAVVDPTAQTGDENYLLVGSDTRAGTNGQIGAGTTAEAGGARSDTVMLAHVPADRTRVVVVSFPRDLQVDRPECAEWNNDTASYGETIQPGETDSKLNAAYALGGPRCLVKTIQQISGLSINHFVGIDFSGFQKMVDEVGGVTVCTETPLVDGELGTILADPGTQLVNGQTALNYVRARKVEAEGNGDYGRIQRQQRFLSSLLRTALSNQVLLDPGKLTGFVREFTAATFGDNTGFEALLTLGESLQGLDAGRVTFLTVPTTGTSYDGNEIQNRPEIGAIFDAVINDRPLPGEQAAAAETTTTPPPAPPTIPALEAAAVPYSILNATQTGGLATQTGSQLAGVGFAPPTVTENFGSESAETFVQYSAGQEAAAETLASALPGAQTRLVEGLGDRVDLVVGTDFTGEVVAPTPAGEPLDATTDPAAPLPSDVQVLNGDDTSCA